MKLSDVMDRSHWLFEAGSDAISNYRNYVNADPKLKADEGFREEINAALDSICGHVINQGDRRLIWSHRNDENLVVKMSGLGNYFLVSKATGRKAYDNINECNIWEESKRKGVSEWFAPVEWHSPRKWVICQRKAEQLPNRKADPEIFPEYIPDFLVDDDADTLRLANWGSLDGRPVLLDYGFMEGIGDCDLVRIMILDDELELDL